jgi:integrase/recombinase XerD
VRHYLFTWLKTQGVNDANIQPYSGRATRQSLEVYCLVSLTTARAFYNGGHRRVPDLNGRGS